MTLRVWPLIALVVLSICWGYTWVLNKLALLDAGPLGFAAYRMLIASACLLLMLPITGRPFRPQRLPELINLGLIQTTAFVGLSMWALVAGGVGPTAILVFTMPFWTMLFAWPALGERIRGLQWLGVALAGCGLIAILKPWTIMGSLSSKLMALGAGAAWALSTVMVKRLQARAPMDLLSLTAWQMLFGAVPLVLIAIFVGEAAVVWSARFTFVLLGTAIVSTALCWFLWIYVLKHLAAGVASMCMLTIPIIAILSSSLQLGERPLPEEIVGMGLITLALLLVSYRALRQHRELAGPIGQE